MRWSDQDIALGATPIPFWPVLVPWQCVPCPLLSIPDGFPGTTKAGGETYSEARERYGQNQYPDIDANYTRGRYADCDFYRWCI